MKTISWRDYVPLERTPAMATGIAKVPLAEAKRVFDEVMATKALRIAMLRGLLSRQGIDLTGDDASIRALNAWLLENVQGAEGRGELASPWHSVTHDIALFLGDEIIRRAPSLEWRVFANPKRNIAHHLRPVLMGFTKTARARQLSIDLEHEIARNALAVVQGGEAERDLFLKTIELTLLLT
jgi:hypothetical protein